MKDDNFTEKPISEFNSKDTLYASVTSSGMTYSILLQFISFEKGVVTGKILSIEPNNITAFWKGKELIKVGNEFSCRIIKCNTYKPRKGVFWFTRNPTKKDYFCTK